MSPSSDIGQPHPYPKELEFIIHDLGKTTNAT